MTKKVPAKFSPGWWRMKFPREYNSWQAMKQRCLNPNCDSYKDYGGRGITIDLSWVNSFERFMIDMGPRPKPNYSLDRTDNSEGYSAFNCEWEHPITQARNRRRKGGWQP